MHNEYGEKLKLSNVVAVFIPLGVFISCCLMNWKFLFDNVFLSFNLESFWYLYINFFFTILAEDPQSRFMSCTHYINSHNPCILNAVKLANGMLLLWKAVISSPNKPIHKHAFHICLNTLTHFKYVIIVAF